MVAWVSVPPRPKEPKPTQRQLAWKTVMLIESPFLDTPLDFILLILFGGWRHCGWQEQQGGEDQGGRWHYDVSLQLEISSTRMWYAVVMMVDMKVFILSTYVTTLSTCELVVDNTVDDKDTKEEKTREVPDIITSHVSLQLEFV